MEKITLNLKPDYEGEVVASLYKFDAVNSCINGAILYIHGYIDYFFHEHVAQFFTSRGFDFYALDLRKYGESLLPNQHFNYCRNLNEYFEEIDISLDIISIRSKVKKISVIGHSTGGLLISLYADRGDKRDMIKNIILNSPFFNFNTSFLKGRIIVPIVSSLSLLFPYIYKKNEIPLSYFNSIHSSKRGEWNFDVKKKPSEGVPLYFAWLRAISLAQKELRRGFFIDVPLLILSSDRSSFVDCDDSDALSTDRVLNVLDIERYSKSISGKHVEYMKFEGSLHDIFLSSERVRNRALEISLNFLLSGSTI